MMRLPHVFRTLLASDKKCSRSRICTITKNARQISIDASSKGHDCSMSPTTFSTRDGARLSNCSAQSNQMYFAMRLSAKYLCSLASPAPMSRIVLSVRSLGKNLW